MTPTEMARRSDALYMDTNNAHRRQLCDMIAHRESDIEELKEEVYGLHCDIGRLETENAMLRELANIGEHAAKECSSLAEQNAKLRELLVDACGYINHPFDASWTHMKRKEARDSLNDRMRELGIEAKA